jgi:RNA polymerase sigma-70 factor (ECF subfamily)
MIEAERRLIREAIGGNEKAFRAILERHYTLIYSVVRGVLGVSGETEDVVQDVFIKIFRALPDFRGESRLSTWIYRIARNEALNARGRSTRQFVPLDDCADVGTDQGNPETGYRRKVHAEQIERLMQRLDERERVVLELRYRGEKSYEEIAEMMEIPLGTVKTHIYRAKHSLRRMIANSGPEPLEKGRRES